ncbi:glycosyltransferase family 1 protein [Paraburkholderia sp. A3BS-1L]|uniref:glycosyltransferase family 4 protein n=1 Tax=Paraburkholderia sp. A3BS-1L TaxID=3028375 RepID=UPI003DA9A6A2
MQIYLDISRLCRRLLQKERPTGVDRVSLAYVRHYQDNALAVLSENGVHVILSKANSLRAFDWLLTQSAANTGRLRWLIGQAILASGFSPTPAPGILLHTAHSGVESPRYFRSLRRKGIRVAFMVHDLIPLTHAEYARPDTPARHARRIDTVLNHAAGIIANSGATLTSVVDYARSTGAPMPPTVTARLAPAITYRGEISHDPVGAPFFLMLGTIEPRKNHWLMLHIWRRLVELRGADAPMLVIVGRRGWECENVIDMLERCSELRGFVIEKPDCDDEYLYQLLQHARALLFPSFVEGYGMPLAEALALSVPVLASDLAVFREIAGDIPDYLDPLDGNGWLDRIQNYAAAPCTARDEQLARIKRFNEPTWTQHFEAVDNFLPTLG